VSHVRTSARAIIERDGELLVVRYRDERGDWYALPGGGQRHGEGLEAALVREVAEEAGLGVRVGPLRFVRECIAGPGSRGLSPDFHQVEFFFACDLLGPAGTGQAEPDPTQVGTEWCTPAKLRERCFFPPALLDALERRQEFGYLGVV
jgi:ADP-ribose pyrophosphatase YjhB (NUDIX family)